MESIFAMDRVNIKSAESKGIGGAGRPPITLGKSTQLGQSLGDSGSETLLSTDIGDEELVDSVDENQKRTE